MVDAELVKAWIRKAIADSRKPKRVIAHALDVSPQAVSKWVKTGEISREHLLGLARITGCALDQVAGVNNASDDPVVDVQVVVQHYAEASARAQEIVRAVLDLDAQQRSPQSSNPPLVRVESSEGNVLYEGEERRRNAVPVDSDRRHK